MATARIFDEDGNSIFVHRETAQEALDALLEAEDRFAAAMDEDLLAWQAKQSRFALRTPVR